MFVDLCFFGFIIVSFIVGLTSVLNFNESGNTLFVDSYTMT